MRYSDKLVRRNAFKACKNKGKDLLNDMTDNRNDYQLLVIINYHLNISILKDIMPLLHLLLTPDHEYEKVPITVFRIAKILKDILVRTKVPPMKKSEGFSRPCKKKICQISDF